MTNLSYTGKTAQGSEQTIDFGSIGSISSQLQETATWLISEIDQLDGELTSQLSYWTGSAQAAYRRAHEQWKSAALDLAGVMRRIASAVDESNSNYQRTEKGVTSQFS